MAKPKTFISIGHYPKRPGAMNTNYGLKEYDEAKKIADALFTRTITPQSLFSYILVKSGPLREKVAFINEKAVEGSIAVEIHYNASESHKAQGIETLFFPGSTQGKILCGSANYSKVSDTRNCEDLVLISSKKVGRIFEARFSYLWEKSVFKR